MKCYITFTYSSRSSITHKDLIGEWLTLDKPIWCCLHIAHIRVTVSGPFYTSSFLKLSGSGNESQLLSWSNESAQNQIKEKGSKMKNRRGDLSRHSGMVGSVRVMVEMSIG